MALKVGMRVRVVRVESGTKVRVGMVGTITASATPTEAGGGFIPDWEVVLDELPECEWGAWVFASYHLAPLTDPRESEWADSKVRELEKLVREPIPLTDKQMEDAHG